MSRSRFMILDANVQQSTKILGDLLKFTANDEFFPTIFFYSTSRFIRCYLIAYRVLRSFVKVHLYI